ncbi:catechol 2,3-dioxygenase [Frankia sp. Hr75.2]|uniref:VOC family protein n=1 Tax=Parafrankia soli TaxID=2599596 RepID=UPI0028A3E8F5|nr:catechol 2,3-dioxygenase [Frankia sp. Hr75.2]
MQIKELGHIVLYVRDLDRSAHFYRDILGWRPAYSGDEPLRYRGMAFNAGGRTHHELLLLEVGRSAAPLQRGRHVGLYHFGLKVGDNDDELREVLATLVANGVPIRGATDHGFTHSLYIFDPDGNEIELFVDVPGVDWDDPAHWTDPTARPLRL